MYNRQKNVYQVGTFVDIAFNLFSSCLLLTRISKGPPFESPGEATGSVLDATPGHVGRDEVLYCRLVLGFLGYFIQENL